MSPFSPRAPPYTSDPGTTRRRCTNISGSCWCASSHLETPGVVRGTRERRARFPLDPLSNREVRAHLSARDDDSHPVRGVVLSRPRSSSPAADEFHAGNARTTSSVDAKSRTCQVRTSPPFGALTDIAIYYCFYKSYLNCLARARGHSISAVCDPACRRYRFHRARSEERGISPRTHSGRV